MAQAAPGPPPNADPDRLRAIVKAEAQKAGTKAVVFEQISDNANVGDPADVLTFFAIIGSPIAPRQNRVSN